VALWDTMENKDSNQMVLLPILMLREGELRWSLPIVPSIFESNDEFIDPLRRSHTLLPKLMNGYYDVIVAIFYDKLLMITFVWYFQLAFQPYMFD